MSNVIQLHPYLNEKVLQSRALADEINNLKRTSDFYEDIEMKADILAYRHLGYDYELYTQTRFIEDGIDKITVEIETPSVLITVKYRNVDGIALAYGGISIEDNRNILKFKV